MFKSVKNFVDELEPQVCADPTALIAVFTITALQLVGTKTSTVYTEASADHSKLTRGRLQPIRRITLKSVRRAETAL